MKQMKLLLASIAILAQSLSASGFSSSGGGAGGPTTLTGDVTGTGTGTVPTTIPAGTVTTAKMANVAANSILGNNTGAPVAPIVLTAAQTKTLLAIANTDVSGLGTAATAATGTAAHTVPFLDGVNTFSGANTFSSSLISSFGFSLNSEAAISLKDNSLTTQGRLTGITTGSIFAIDGDTIKFRNLANTVRGTLDTTGLAMVGTISGSNLGTDGLPTSIATGTIIGRSAAGTGAASALTVLPTAAMPALTGDVTSSAGSLTTALSSATVVSKVAAQALAPASVAATGVITSSGATSGIGYATGAGGAVTQITSRTTGVTNNKACGAITMFSAAGSATWATFTVTDSAVAATDTIIANEKSGTNLYMLAITAVGAGTFNLSFATTGGTAVDAPVINYCVIKGVAA